MFSKYWSVPRSQAKPFVFYWTPRFGDRKYTTHKIQNKLIGIY